MDINKEKKMISLEVYDELIDVVVSQDDEESLKEIKDDDEWEYAMIIDIQTIIKLICFENFSILIVNGDLLSSVCVTF